MDLSDLSESDLLDENFYPQTNSDSTDSDSDTTSTVSLFPPSSSFLYFYL